MYAFLNFSCAFLGLPQNLAAGFQDPCRQREREREEGRKKRREEERKGMKKGKGKGGRVGGQENEKLYHIL